MKHCHVPLLAVILLVLSVHRSFAPPLPPMPPMTSVAVTIPDISTSGASLVAIPVAKVAEQDVTPPASPYKVFAPGAASVEGHLVIERTWTLNANDWKLWFDGTAQGQNLRKVVSLAYSATGPGVTVLWRDCVPVRYQLLPGTGNSVKERLYLKSSGFEPAP